MTSAERVRKAPIETALVAIRGLQGPACAGLLGRLLAARPLHTFILGQSQAVGKPLVAQSIRGGRRPMLGSWWCSGSFASLRARHHALARTRPRRQPDELAVPRRRSTDPRVAQEPAALRIPLHAYKQAATSPKAFGSLSGFGGPLFLLA
jgi:hypothetical protein